MKQILLFFNLILFCHLSFAQVPANDLIENATLVNFSPLTETNVRLDNANTSTGVQNGCSVSSWAIIYYKFTATNSNDITITIEDSYGLAIGNSFAIVYSAPDLNVTNDNQLSVVSTCAFSTQTTFTPNIGTSYYVLVHRSNGGSNYSNVTIDIPQIIPSSEKTALQDLYNNTNGAGWTNQDNWNTTNPESSWYGVTVNNGHVSKLTLSANNLNGTIPASILNLPFLEEINFRNNNISGTLPNLGSLATINSVNITNNDFSFADIETNYTSNNTIASFIYQTQNKRETEASFDGVLGSSYTLTISPISGTNVQYQWYKKRYNYFNASDEAIAGETGNAYNIASLQNQDFDAYFCRVTSSSIPDLVIDRNSIEIKGEVSQLQKDALIAIYNSTNGVGWTNNTNWLSIEPVNDWHGVTVTGNRVTELDFTNNNLTGTLPQEIGNLTGLEFLSFYSGNSINGTLPTEIGNLTELRLLSIENNNFTGPIPVAYANLTKLRGFWFNNNQLSGEVPSFAAANYPNLVYFDISFNNFQGVLPDFTALQNLNYININNNHFYPSDFSNQFNDYVSQVNWSSSYYYTPQTTLDPSETQVLDAGDAITLTISDSSTASNKTSFTSNYQWYKDDVIISGANTNPYVINNAQPSDSGVYHCVISDNAIPNFEIKRAPITVDVGTLGLEDVSLIKNQINIYPVPTKQYINIVTNLEINTLEIIDINGRLITTINNPKTKINVSNLADGNYFIRFITPNNFVTKRFIKH